MLPIILWKWLHGHNNVSIYHDCRHCRRYSVSIIYYSKGIAMHSFAALLIYIVVFVCWVKGVTVPLASHDYFWAVFNFAFFPAGVIVGAFNFLF